MTRRIFDAPSKAKRKAQTRHWKQARLELRRRDWTHHDEWKILMLAGRAPEGEVAIIRDLMPKAVITAVDRDPVAIEAARAAGVDEVVQCNLAKIHRENYRGAHWFPPPAFLGREFDAIHLDFCNVLTPGLKRLMGVYMRHCVKKLGVFIFTFSYGRDVAEAFGEPEPELLELTGSPALAARLTWLLKPMPWRDYPGAKDYGSNAKRLSTMYVCSIISYPGTMPMCSIFASRVRPLSGFKYHKVT